MHAKHDVHDRLPRNVPARNAMARTAPSATILLAAASALLSVCLGGCIASTGDAFGAGGGGGAGAGGGSTTTCSETRCDGERTQCVKWYNMDRDDCADNCAGTMDDQGCVANCFDLAQSLISSVCDDEFDTCTASDKVNECWDSADPEGKCVGTSEISCPDVSYYETACDTVPGCEASGTYDDGLTLWSCGGQPAPCSDMKDAKSCRALRCTWQ